MADRCHATSRATHVLPYSGFLSREKLSANCLKIDFRGENLCEFAVTQCTTPTSAVSNCLKIDFRGENFRESPQKHEIRESFLPRKKPAIRYIVHALALALVRPLHAKWQGTYRPRYGHEIFTISAADVRPQKYYLRKL